MKIMILGKEQYKSKSGKEVYKLHCGRVIEDNVDKPVAVGVSVFSAFTNEITFDKLIVDFKNGYDLAVFFNDNGFHNVYLKKGDK